MRNLTFITPTVVVVVAAVVRIDRVVVELGGFFGSEEGEKVFSIEKRDLAFHFHSLRSSRTAATVGKAFDAAQKQRRGTFSLVSSFAQALSFIESIVSLNGSHAVQYSHFIFLRCVILSSVCECFLLTKTVWLKNTASILGVPQDAFAKPFSAV
jgi:hypothetical protein